MESSQKLDALDDRLMRDEEEDGWPGVAAGLGGAGSIVQVTLRILSSSSFAELPHVSQELNRGITR